MTLRGDRTTAPARAALSEDRIRNADGDAGTAVASCALILAGKRSCNIAMATIENALYFTVSA
jgi:hypothetical protein